MGHATIYLSQEASWDTVRAELERWARFAKRGIDVSPIVGTGLYQQIYRELEELMDDVCSGSFERSGYGHAWDLCNIVWRIYLDTCNRDTKPVFNMMRACCGHLSYVIPKPCVLCPVYYSPFMCDRLWHKAQRQGDKFPTVSRVSSPKHSVIYTLCSYELTLLMAHEGDVDGVRERAVGFQTYCKLLDGFLRDEFE